MKFTRKTLILAAAGAVLVTATGAMAATGTLQTVAYTVSGHKLFANTQTATKAGLQTASPSPSASATPSAKPAAPSASPTPAGYNAKLDSDNRPCMGIHAADDDCVTKDATLQIASVDLWAKTITCNGSDASVVFDPLNLTRTYTSGGGGTAQVQIDYSDGTSSPVISLTFTPATDVRYYDGLAHVFANAATASFRVRVISPNTTSQNWELVKYATMGYNCLNPAPTPYPTPSPAPTPQP